MNLLNKCTTNEIKLLENAGFSSNAICLKSYSENYEDIEIGRYRISNS